MGRLLGILNRIVLWGVLGGVAGYVVMFAYNLAFGGLPLEEAFAGTTTQRGAIVGLVIGLVIGAFNRP